MSSFFKYLAIGLLLLNTKLMAESPKFVVENQCHYFLGAFTSDKFRHLSVVPNLSQLIQDLMSVSETPDFFNKLLSETLVGVDINVIPLTSEVRRDLNISSNIKAFASNPTRIRSDHVTPMAVSTNAKNKKQINFKSHLWRKGYFNLGIEDTINMNITEEHLIRVAELIHELAHVHLFDVWQRNAKVLMTTIPEFIDYDEGTYFLNGQLSDYLQERYAFEMYFQTMFSLNRISNYKYSYRFPNGKLYEKIVNSSTLGQDVESLVEDIYNISDKKVLNRFSRRNLGVIMNELGLMNDPNFTTLFNEGWKMNEGPIQKLLQRVGIGFF